jgi:hypothetical protein
MTRSAARSYNATRFTLFNFPLLTLNSKPLLVVPRVSGHELQISGHRSLVADR